MMDGCSNNLNHTEGSCTNKKKKQKWSELYSEIGELRRQLSCLSSMLPSSIVFKDIPNTGGRTRIYFLAAPPPTAWESTLLAVDVPAVGEIDANRSVLQWQPVLETNFQTLSSGGRLSREEQLLWERKRLSTWGLTSYELNADYGRIVFPVAGRLYQCVDRSITATTVSPRELVPNLGYAKLHPNICPHNPDLVAFTCLNDIWVTHTTSGSTERLTHFHHGHPRSLSEDPLSAGVPSYITQEEFSRYTGFWWQPEPTTPGLYRIVFELVDESEVEIHRNPSSSYCEEFRFPKAGTPNAKSELKIAQFQLSPGLQIIDVRILSLEDSLYKYFPFFEYLVRVGWTQEGTHVWCQLLDRKQKRLDISLIPLDNFCIDAESSPRSSYSSVNSTLQHHSINHNSQTICTIYSEITDVWVNVHDILYFFPSEKGSNQRTFLWASEESGYRHLYLITVAIIPVLNNTPALDEIPTTRDKASVISRIALTSGEWEVLPDDIWVDEERSFIFFMGLRETPLEKHLYVVSLRRPGEVKLLTRPGYSYACDIDSSCSLMVGVYSNIRQLPACQVFRINVTDWVVEGVNLSPIGYLLEPRFPETDLHCPEILTHQLASGETVYAMIFKPKDFDPSKQYPTVLNIYGGPEVQLVSNSFKGSRHLRLHMLATKGYCVLAIDSRGSLHRGVKFESHLHYRMGTVELADQVEVLRGLAARLGFIDLNRIAIHGWSYGGYLSLLGLAIYPDVFKLAIAGAPVTSWSYYDTGYTERYMGLPDQNVLGYRAGSVLQYTHQFPEEEDRLLIIHGLMDENVHFHHTSMLISALVKAGKPYALHIYPNERHSLRSVDASKHYETKLFSFLTKHL